MVQKVAKLTIEDNEFNLPIYSGTLGPDVIDINQLGKENIFTFDPGFMSTAACESKITFIDGEKGILLYRGYPIEELAQKCNYMEVCYLLLNGELPNKEQKTGFEQTIMLSFHGPRTNL